MTALTVLIEGAIAGRLESDRRGRPAFEYDPAWRESPRALPLSLAFPLAGDTPSPETVDAVLWGLLPDNDRILQRWAGQFHVSARNALALLAHIGEDCAGAVQFCADDRVAALQSGADDGVEWLADDDIAQRLRDLRVGGTGRNHHDAGQFSLAGAQAKTALLHEDGRWGIPRGRIPTTHILKPPGAQYDGFAENEAFCLALARRLGLPAAASDVLRFGEEVALSVTRYDRVRQPDRWRRVHQEDLCQAMAVHPASKYQNQGGPTPRDIGRLLHENSSRPADDVRTFFQALALNWVLAGTDAHAKNYSLLIGAGGRVRLAPLYDIASAYPYPALPLRKINLAMKLGSHYRWWEVRHADWLHLIDDLGLARDVALGDLARLLESVRDEASALHAAMKADGVDHPSLHRLIAALHEQVPRCLRIAGGTMPAESSGTPA